MHRDTSVYMIMLGALIQLDVDKEYLETVKEITKEDFKMADDVTEENRVGQQSSTLAWFWRLGGDLGSEDTEINPRLKECKPVLLAIEKQIADEHTVYWVNWLWAKAQLKR
jgi:hypothetical protein